MSIRARILALVGCFAVMALAVTTLGLMTISDYNRMMRDYDHAYENAWRGERLNHLVSNVVMETRGLYIARSDEELQGFVKGLNHNLDDMQTLLTTWKGSLGPEEASRLLPLETEAKSFITLRREVARLAGSGQVEAAHSLSTNSRSDRIAFQGKVEGIVQQTLTELSTAKTRAASYNQRRSGDFLLTCLIGVVIMIGLSLWIITRFVTAPLRALATAIVGTSRGDYDMPLDTGEGKDEVSSVWRALCVLKQRAMEAERLAAAEREAEHQRELKLRELVLD